jgi:dolichol-phosphate mannosyltransferase
MVPPERTVMVVPTYNEAENLASLVARVRSTTPSVDILVVDDKTPHGNG